MENIIAYFQTYEAGFIAGSIAAIAIWYLLWRFITK